MKVGDLVWMWWDTGAFGSTVLYGQVIAAGPKTYRVRLESGLTNRITRGGNRVEPQPVRPTEAEDARRAMRRAG